MVVVGRHALQGLVRARVELLQPAMRVGQAPALEAAQAAGVQVAVLTERSPSCGSAFLYDGTFSSQLQEGEGVTAALLRQHGIRIFSQHQLEEAGRLLDALDAQDRADSSIGKP
mgnify:CR=1 FL=1